MTSPLSIYQKISRQDPLPTRCRSHPLLHLGNARIPLEMHLSLSSAPNYDKISQFGATAASALPKTLRGYFSLLWLLSHRQAPACHFQGGEANNNSGLVYMYVQT